MNDQYIQKGLQRIQKKLDDDKDKIASQIASSKRNNVSKFGIGETSF